MMSKLLFRPIDLSDCQPVQRQVYTTECRNCDLNFMNLMSWRFLYGTELVFHKEWLLFRFRAEGKLAYLFPVGNGDWSEVLQDMMDDAHFLGEDFRLMGMCDRIFQELAEKMSDRLVDSIDPSFTDYIYLRESLATLTGKKLQPKRNHINKFIKTYPGYEFQPLTPGDFQECLALVERWHRQKGQETQGRLTAEEELNALNFTFEHWEELFGRGGALRVDGQLVAFTYGAPINYDTFDICVEKADVDYEGAFTMINREFARSLPPEYIYLNREEDLGIEGLRKAKLSYQPTFLLNKHTVIVKP